MNDLIVHKINIAHYRLIELITIADQAKPFYNWVEKQAKRTTGSHKSLNDILLTCSKTELKNLIKACYHAPNEQKPFLFDGIGRVYPHRKACFYFFAWIIRDAPQQRLSPLIARMKKADNVTKIIAETDSLVELIFEYRTIVKSFEWAVVREVVLDRLEGSRRSISGHRLEANVRTSLITAIQYYYSIYGNYGKFNQIKIADKQIKIGKHTIDVSADFISKSAPSKINNNVRLLIPVKTRETEGGGHSHLFTRDLMTAITDLKKDINHYHIVVIIVAENWSGSELSAIQDEIDIIFHFNMNPNQFTGFDESSQVKLNKYIEKILAGEIN